MSSKTYVYPSKTYILLMGLGRIETQRYRLVVASADCF
nr:MAG TPA: hypothetical protein [Caudoviricetes sp.]